MPHTCIAYDASAPQQLQEAIKLHLKEEHLDTHMSCLLEDTGGKPCKGPFCSWSASDKKKVPDFKDRTYNSKPRVDPPQARPPKSKAAKRKPAAKGKAKKGRRK